jgi:hypothetical protein
MQAMGASPAATELAKMLATYQRQLGSQDSIGRYLASSGLTTSRLNELVSATSKSAFPSILNMQAMGASPAATEFAKMLATYQRQLGSQDSIERYLASTGLTTSRLNELAGAASKSAFPSFLDMQAMGASPAATEFAKMLATYQRQLGSQDSISRYLTSSGVTGDTLERVYERAASLNAVGVPLPKAAKRKRSKRKPKKLTTSNASNDAKP